MTTPETFGQNIDALWLGSDLAKGYATTFYNFHMDDLVVDYTNATFPLLPSTTPANPDGRARLLAESSDHRAERYVHSYGHARRRRHCIVQRRQHRSRERRHRHQWRCDVRDQRARRRQPHHQHNLYSDIRHTEHRNAHANREHRDLSDDDGGFFIRESVRPRTIGNHHRDDLVVQRHADRHCHFHRWRDNVRIGRRSHRWQSDLHQQHSVRRDSHDHRILYRHRRFHQQQRLCFAVGLRNNDNCCDLVGQSFDFRPVHHADRNDHRRGTSVPTGTVKFTDGTTTLASAATVTAGKATFTSSTLAIGSHSITAAFTGTGGFTTSSGTLTQTVQIATSNSVASSANPSNPAASVTFTATVTSTNGIPQGTMAFKDGTTTLASGVAVSTTTGKATFSTSSLAAGTHSITAVFTGNAGWLASTSTAINQVVNATTTTTVTASPSPQTTGLSVTITATVTSSVRHADRHRHLQGRHNDALFQRCA